MRQSWKVFLIMLHYSLAGSNNELERFSLLAVYLHCNERATVSK
jgi:hypothetical protein